MELEENRVACDLSDRGARERERRFPRKQKQAFFLTWPPFLRGVWGVQHSLILEVTVLVR